MKSRKLQRVFYLLLMFHTKRNDVLKRNSNVHERYIGSTQARFLEPPAIFPAQNIKPNIFTFHWCAIHVFTQTFLGSYTQIYLNFIYGT